MDISANPQLLQILAASHALGTLRGGARRRFEAIAREQANVRAAALTWQGRLASMTELQAPIAPDAAVWIRIHNLIEAEQAVQTAVARPQHTAAPRANGWLRNLWLWRGVSLVGALATVTAVVVGVNLQQQLANAPTVQYVAVLADDKAAASMLVTFDPKNQQLALQRMGDYQVPADKSLQLWALPPGGAPRALGVLSDARTLKLSASEADIRAIPTLAVSLEPKGGVPGDQGPTGPVLFHGPLVEKTL